MREKGKGGRKRQIGWNGVDGWMERRREETRHKKRRIETTGLLLKRGQTVFGQSSKALIESSKSGFWKRSMIW